MDKAAQTVEGNAIRIFSMCRPGRLCVEKIMFAARIETIINIWWSSENKPNIKTGDHWIEAFEQLEKIGSHLFWHCRATSMRIAIG